MYPLNLSDFKYTSLSWVLTGFSILNNDYDNDNIDNDNDYSLPVNIKSFEYTNDTTESEYGFMSIAAADNENVGVNKRIIFRIILLVFDIKDFFISLLLSKCSFLLDLNCMLLYMHLDWWK